MTNELYMLKRDVESLSKNITALESRLNNIEDKLKISCEHSTDDRLPVEIQAVLLRNNINADKLPEYTATQIYELEGMKDVYMFVNLLMWMMKKGIAFKEMDIRF